MPALEHAIIMQRLHEDDLVGHVLGQEPWEVVCFPAIAEADEVHEIATIWGPQRFTRRRGDALHPAREPLATLEHIRRTIGEYNFAGQYQQSPAPLGGGLVKEAWFKSYSETERPERFDRIVQSWDTANKATELSDFSVCTTWGIRGKDLYLLNVLRKRLEYPALKRAVPRVGQHAHAEMGIYEHTRRMAEKLTSPERFYVRLKAPPGIGAVQTLSGRHINIGEDRIVEMYAEDANCLIPYGWTKLAE